MRSKSHTQISKTSFNNSNNEEEYTSLIFSLSPKHLSGRKKRVTSLSKLKYQQSATERIERQKIKYMKPLTEVELIMKKFDEVIKDKRQLTQSPVSNPKLQKMFESELDKKIKGLLSLPTIKKIKQTVKNSNIVRTITQPQSGVLLGFGQGSKLNLLRQYEQYIKAATKPVYKQHKTISS